MKHVTAPLPTIATQPITPKAEPFVTGDLYLAGLLSFKGFEPTIQMLGGRAMFYYAPDPALADLMRGFEMNTLQGSLGEYAAHVRKMRAKMLAARDNATHQR